MPSLSNFILYVILITHTDNPALPLSINDSLRTPVIATLPQSYLSPAFPTASEWVPCPTPWSERSSLLNIVPWGPASPRWFGRRLCSWSSRWPRMSWPLLASTHSSCSTGWSALLHLSLLAFSFQRPEERPSQSCALCTNRRWTHFQSVMPTLGGFHGNSSLRALSPAILPPYQQPGHLKGCHHLLKAYIWMFVSFGRDIG